MQTQFYPAVYDPPNSIDLSGEWSQCPPHAEDIFQKYISG